MNIKALSNKVTSSVGLKTLAVKKQSPTIMFGLGVAGVVATVVLASRATLKLESVLDEVQEDIAKPDLAREKRPDIYTEEDRQREKAINYAKAVVKVGKLYGPAVLVGTASIGLLTGSHVVLTKRNTGLMAAYAAVDQAFREFDARVRAKYGEDEARELRHGFTEKEVYKEHEDGGYSTEIKKTAAGKSRYSFWFAKETTSCWNNTPEANLFFLRTHQSYLNDKLNTRGYVMLNDVLDALGLDRTSAGAVVGWVSKKNDGGDGYIDFGIMDDDKVTNLLDFMNGHSDGLMLDFNVDGVVYNLIDKI